MSRGLGARQRDIIGRLKRARAPLRTAALAAGRTASAMTCARRALCALERDGKVQRWPNDRRLWLPMLKTKPKSKRPKALPGQLELWPNL